MILARNAILIKIALLLSALFLPVSNQVAAESVHWPTEQWRENLADPKGEKGKEVQSLQAYLFPKDVTVENFSGIQTDGVVIVKDGEIVFEQYRAPYHKNKVHLSWSMAKSFTNALYGIAVLQGKLNLDDPVDKYVPLRESELEPLKLKHVLQMSSGLDWKETYEDEPYRSNVIAMLFASGRMDMGSYVADVDRIYPPGTYWRYSSGDTNLLSKALSVALGAGYQDFPWEELFQPLGMGKVTFEQDSSGIFVGSSYIYATPRDFARFGYLFLNDGVWDGKRILPEGWVEFSTSLSPGLSADARSTFANHGAHWWLNQGDESRGLPRSWENAPLDTYGAFGHWGQSVVIIPSHNIVATRVANDRDKTFDLDTYLGMVIKAFGNSALDNATEMAHTGSEQ